MSALSLSRSYSFLSEKFSRARIMRRIMLLLRIAVGLPFISFVERDSYD